MGSEYKKKKSDIEKFFLTIKMSKGAVAAVVITACCLWFILRRRPSMGLVAHPGDMIRCLDLPNTGKEVKAPPPGVPPPEFHAQSEVYFRLVAAYWEFDDFMRKLGVPVFISHGTLLGWYRNCDIVFGANNVAFTVDERHFTPEVLKKLENLDPEFNIHLAEIIGRVSDSYKLRFRVHGAIVELSVAYPLGAGHYYSTDIHQKAKLVRYTYPGSPDPDRLCSGELLGRKVGVPCDPEAVLGAEFGAWEKWSGKWDPVADAKNARIDESAGVDVYRELPLPSEEPNNIDAPAKL